MLIQASSLLKAWDSTLHAAANGSGDFALRKTESIGPVVIQISDLTERIPLAKAGFQSRRWLRYVDDYLHGGPAFVKFLQRYPVHSIIIYQFGGSQQHTHGPCIQQVTVKPQAITLVSRACDLCPTGVLDLTLLWWIGQVTGVKKAEWQIQKAKLSIWQSVARADILKVISGTALEPELRNYLRAHESTYQTLKFARAKSVFRRRYFQGSLDEEEVILNPVRINPNDLQELYGIKRTKIQGYLKEQYGWSAQGSGNRSYSWASYDDPIFQDVLERFKMDPHRLPPIHQVAEQRSRRFDRLAMSD